ncbi:MAG: DUF418 domain-containing protein [Hyphomonadaceae bacterium]
MNEAVAAALSPVRKSERIESLDVMRGLAVLGILAVNAGYFAAPWQAMQNPLLAPLGVTHDTLWSWLVMHVFFELKFITLFSLLFGVSIYLVGGDGEEPARSALLRRRLFWLLAFGLLHATLIWSGDILVTYALTGMIVMRARSWPAITLAVMGSAIFAASVVLMSLFGLMAHSFPASEIAEIEAQVWAPPAAEIARAISAYRTGLATAMAENFATWSLFMQSGLVSIVVRSAGVMMIGMALFKTGFMSGRSPAWIYGAALAAGACALMALGWEAWRSWLFRFDFLYMQQHAAPLNEALSIFVSIAYAGLCIVLTRSGARFVTAPLAAAGRMAFTNYIAQSLIMTTIFWGGRGLALFGQMDRPSLWSLVAAVWVLQLVWSPLWLSRFEMGPLEWVWRRLAYQRAIPFARASRAEAH